MGTTGRLDDLHTGVPDTAEEVSVASPAPEEWAPVELPPEPIGVVAGAVQLRPWEHRLAPELLAACRDAEFRRWIWGAIPQTPTEARAWIDEQTASWHRGEALYFAVQQATTAELLGCVGFDRFAQWPRGAEMSYWTAPVARRRGVALVAVNTIARWGFGALGLHRITLHHAVENVASCAVAQRCGFTVEGVARAAAPDPAGGWFDMECHARLAADPPPGGATDPRPATPSA
jgi:RimJ/RimL family protein N-acetyltransferase